MKTKEFDKSKFFFGMKGKVDGIWYPLDACDFEERTILIDNGKESIIQCADIEELEKLHVK